MVIENEKKLLWYVSNCIGAYASLTNLAEKMEDPDLQTFSHAKSLGASKLYMMLCGVLAVTALRSGECGDQVLDDFINSVKDLTQTFRQITHKDQSEAKNG